MPTPLQVGAPFLPTSTVRPALRDLDFDNVVFHGATSTGAGTATNSPITLVDQSGGRWVAGKGCVGVIYIFTSNPSNVGTCTTPGGYSLIQGPIVGNSSEAGYVFSKSIADSDIGSTVAPVWSSSSNAVCTSAYVILNEQHDGSATSTGAAGTSPKMTAWTAPNQPLRAIAFVSGRGAASGAVTNLSAGTAPYQHLDAITSSRPSANRNQAQFQADYIGTSTSIPIYQMTASQSISYGAIGVTTVKIPVGQNYQQALAGALTFGNVSLTTAEQGFEDGTLGRWVGGGSVPPTLTNSATHPRTGTKSMLITWGTAGSFPSAQIDLTGFVVGRRYRCDLWAYVPTGSPLIAIVQAAGLIGTTTSGFDAYAYSYVEFTAATTTQTIQIWPASTPSSGQQAWIDDVAVTDMSLAKATSRPIPGVLSFTGSLLRAFPKALAGVLSFTGAHTKQTNKANAGVLSFTGSLAKGSIFLRNLTGVLSFTGTLTNAKIFLRTLTGVLTFTGSHTKRVGKANAGVLTFTGSNAKRTSRALPGVLTFTGTFAKSTLRNLAGTLTFTGTLTNAKIFLRTMSGVLTFTGAHTKRTGKANAGVLTFTGSNVKAITRNFAGVLSFTGSVGKRIPVTLAGVLTFTGSIPKRTGKAAAGVLTFTGSMTSHSVFTKALAGVLSFTGTFVKRTNKANAGVLTFTGTLPKRTSRALAGVLTFAGSIPKRVNRPLAGVLSFTGSLTEGSIFIRALSGVLSFTGGVKKQTNKSLAGTLSFAGSISRRVGKALGAVLSFVGNLGLPVAPTGERYSGLAYYRNLLTYFHFWNAPEPPPAIFFTPIRGYLSPPLGRGGTQMGRDQHPGDRFAGFIPRSDWIPRTGNVWLLKDGTVTETQPRNNDDVAHWFQGESSPLTDKEKVALLAAGYGPYVQLKAAGPNQILNPDFQFEIDMAGWEMGWSPGKWSLDPLNGHTAARAAKGITESPTVPTTLVSYYPFQVVPGVTYEMTGWVKSKNALSGSTTDYVDLWLIVNDSEAGANYFAPGMQVCPGSISQHSTTTSYQKLTALVTIPAGKTWARLSPRSVSSTNNIVWWDDFTLNTPAVMGSVPGGIELIQNPGFEQTSTFTSWDTGWAGLAGATCTIDTSVVHSGAQSAKIVAPPWAVTAIQPQQAIVVTPELQYTFSVWAKTSAALPGTGTDGLALWVLCGPTATDADYFAPYLELASGGQESRSSTTGWVHYTATVTIPAGCSFARPSLRSFATVDMTVYWDDVSFSTTPI